MARSPDVILDSTPLDAPTIDVALRVGWLLRTCRLNTADEHRLTASRFADALGVGAAAITKWEKGTEDIDAAGIEGYERLVDLPAGSLRGIIETTRRTFRYATNARSGPGRPSGDLEQISRLVWPAMHGEPRGIDWLHFADALNAGGPLVLPDFTAAPVIARLTSELARSVDSAYLTRYEAMARLRTGPYHNVVLKSLLGFALAEDSQVSIDLLDVAGERPSPELFHDMCRLLLDARSPVFEGACHSLISMAALGGISKPAMRDAVPLLVRAYNALADDPHRHGLMSHVLLNLPPGVATTAGPQLVKPPLKIDTDTAMSKDSPVYVAVQELAGAIKADLPSREDQVLERLLFEAMFDPVWVKRYVARFFLVALPYKDVVARHVTRLADRHDRADVRRAATRISLQMGDASGGKSAERWALSGDPAQQAAGLVSLAHWGVDVDATLLETLVGEPWGVARRALYAAGMSGSPLLRSWADDPARPEQVRSAAAWWLREGMRVTD